MTRIIRRATTGAMATAIALGLALGVAAFTPDGADAMARMDDTLGHSGAVCKFAGDDYSEGSVIKQGDGLTYKCRDGEWIRYRVAPDTGYTAPVFNTGGYYATFR